MNRVAIVGEFDASFPPHAATDAALRHSGDALAVDVRGEWVSAADASPSMLHDYAGVWIAPGSPYRSLENALAVIREAREHGLPCFGTCGGFQHMILEYARNVLGFRDAQHAEYNPYASELFVSQLECSLAGRALHLTFTPGSRIAAVYGATSAIEEYYCNFGVNPEKTALLRSGELRITGSDDEGEVRVIELPHHPFFIGTLFVPQLRSREGSPHPLVSAFVGAVAGLRAEG